MSTDLGSVFTGRRVLVTGHTGFKGSWLCQWLLELGAEVAGFALAPDSEPALFNDISLSDHLDSRIADIRDAAAVVRTVQDVRPEVVFHLAAQPLVRRSYGEPLYTFETNVIGTANLLEAIRDVPTVAAVVNVTTDKVYENPETGHPFTEDELLGGWDPYSASKACSEIVSASYRRSFLASSQIALATARAGNVIGGGDWSEDRIVPDIVRALVADEAVRVRRPESVRPWQHVLDPLAGYLTLAARLLEDGARYSRAYNFGPEPDDVRTVRELVEHAVTAWGTGRWEEPDLVEQPHEAGLLMLAIERAKTELGWRPVWSFDTAVERTVSWYRQLDDGRSALELTREDISAYTEALRSGPGV